MKISLPFRHKAETSILQDAEQSENPNVIGNEKRFAIIKNFYLKNKFRILGWMRTNKKVAIFLAIAVVIIFTSGTFALINTDPKDINDGKSSNDTGQSVIDPEAQPSSEDDKSMDTSNDQTTPNTNTPTSSNNNQSTGQSTTQTPAAINAPIGFVGCSNIRDTVQGYQAGGGTKIWTPPGGTYGGGTVYNWSNLSSSYWDSFDYMFQQNPTTKTIWWGLCTLPPDKESDASNNAAALTVLSEIRKRIPGVTIYVSAMNDYVAPHVCRITGSDGPSRMRTLANSLVSSQGIKAGPSLGSLISSYQTPSAGATQTNNQTKDDGCHPNDAGDLYLGNFLKNFFG